MAGRHSGETLKQVAEPDRIVEHAAPSHCDACHTPLHEAKIVESRQVFALPPLRFEVTEHQVFAAPILRQKLPGIFPENVTAPVQYGPAALAAVVHLTHHPMLPLRRTGQLMGDFFGQPMADATVLPARKPRYCTHGGGWAVQASKVAHADETGLRVAGKLNWMHVPVTATLTWVGCHAKRGKLAFDDFASPDLSAR